MKMWHVVLLLLVGYAVGAFFPGPVTALVSKVQGASA